jgi:hypothetical protein
MACQIEPAELSFQRMSRPPFHVQHDCYDTVVINANTSFFFSGPFTVEVSRTLTIKNPNTTPIAFKVKTTAPKQYADQHADVPERSRYANRPCF